VSRQGYAAVSALGRNRTRCARLIERCRPRWQRQTGMSAAGSLGGNGYSEIIPPTTQFHLVSPRRFGPSNFDDPHRTLRSAFEGFESEPGTRGNSSGCTFQVRHAACPSGCRPCIPPVHSEPRAHAVRGCFEASAQRTVHRWSLKRINRMLRRVEGALEMRFLRHSGIYRSDVIPAGKPGAGTASRWSAP
jgi:hypothetical protein